VQQGEAFSVFLLPVKFSYAIKPMQKNSFLFLQYHFIIEDL